MKWLPMRASRVRISRSSSIRLTAAWMLASRLTTSSGLEESSCEVSALPLGSTTSLSWSARIAFRVDLPTQTAVDTYVQQ